MIGKIFIVGLMSCGMAVGQTAKAPAKAVAAAAGVAADPTLGISFDVVSIKPSGPQSSNQAGVRYAN